MFSYCEHYCKPFRAKLITLLEELQRIPLQKEVEPKDTKVQES
jgi:hypothetical protein